MAIAVRSVASANNNSIAQTSLTVAKPAGMVVGDLLIWAVQNEEGHYGNSALVKSTNDPSNFTDLYTDGYSEVDTKKNYFLDRGAGAGLNRVCCWLGYRFADASDVAVGKTGYTYDIKWGSIGASGTRSDLYCLSGANAASLLLGTPGRGIRMAVNSPAYPVLPAAVDQFGNTLSGRTVQIGIGNIVDGCGWSQVLKAADGSTDLIGVTQASFIVSGYQLISGTLTAMLSNPPAANGISGLYKGSVQISGAAAPYLDHVIPLN